MIHAFRLGPVSTGTPPSFAYAAVFPGGKVELRLAEADPQGLAALRELTKVEPLACEPALADAAEPLRLVVAPLPPEVLQARAVLAYELASGIEHGTARPEAIEALLRAAAAFWASKAWELIAPEEQLHVAFSAGRSLVQGELSMQAADRSQPRLVLCDEPALLARLEGQAGEARVAELLRGAGLTIELAAGPAWAGAAIEEAFKLPRVPMPERRRGGRVASVVTQDLVTAAALLQAVVAFTDLGDGSEAEASVEAATLQVKARVGPTPPDPAALGSLLADVVLTPVGAEGARVPAADPGGDETLSREELAAIVKGGDVPAPAATDAEGSIGPEELAAIVKGAGEPVEAAPASASPAAEDDEAPLTPEELAALLKGGAAAPAPVAAPIADAAPAPEVPAAPEVTLTPVQPPASPPEAARPAPAAASGAAAAPAPAPRPEQATGPGHVEGWMTKAWRALGSSLGRAGATSRSPAVAPPRAARPTPAKPSTGAAARPAPPSRPPAPAAAAPDPDGPFGPFARALRVGVPAEPPPIALADREAAATLGRQLAAGAVDREHLVAFPAVALQIIELVNGPQADARGVAGFISRDPGLAADVLAVANSAAFRGVSEVGSVRDAVARLGMQEVARVASAVSARALLVTRGAGGAGASTRLFTRAVAVATAASSTALRLRGAHSDQVWLAGLLHDVGLALATTAYLRQRDGGAPGVPGPVALLAVEEAHMEIGATALKAWGLPQYIADVCARHHEAEVPAGPDLVDLHLVRLTSALSRLGEREVAARAAREIVQSAGALGFDAHAVRALAADLKAAEQRAATLVR